MLFHVKKSQKIKKFHKAKKSLDKHVKMSIIRPSTVHYPEMSLRAFLSLTRRDYDEDEET
jgi:hypothetical protein